MQKSYRGVLVKSYVMRHCKVDMKEEWSEEPADSIYSASRLVWEGKCYRSILLNEKFTELC